MPQAYQLMQGRMFGRWTILTKLPAYRQNGKRVPISWICLCLCGTQRVVRQRMLTSGKSRSCGCYKAEVAAEQCVSRLTTHGLSGSPEYAAWFRIRYRLYDEKTDMYYRYGGRGITICQRWEASFLAFYEDMGPRLDPTHSLDRIDNNGGYWCGHPDCPECGPLGREPNCRWGTRSQQAENQERIVPITFNGVTQTQAKWAKEIGLTKSGLWSRLKAGWSVERALTTPPDPKKGRHRRKR